MLKLVFVFKQGVFAIFLHRMTKCLETARMKGRYVGEWWLIALLQDIQYKDYKQFMFQYKFIKIRVLMKI